MDNMEVKTTAAALDTTPFIPGRGAIAANSTGAKVTVKGSDDNDTFTTLVDVPANATIGIDQLPAYIKASATGVTLYAGA